MGLNESCYLIVLVLNDGNVEGGDDSCVAVGQDFQVRRALGRVACSRFDHLRYGCKVCGRCSAVDSRLNAEDEMIAGGDLLGELE